MTVRDIMTAMEVIAPKTLAEEWDNVGLLFGDPDAAVTTVAVALDITPEAVAFAKENGAQMIVAHHPLIFAPVKAITAPSALHALCQSGIAGFAAHTNLDAAAGGVNDTLAAVIGLADVKEAFGGIGRVGMLPEEMTAESFAAMVADRLGTAVQLRAGTNAVKTVALVGGAGGDFVTETDADAYLTGELKHHEWLMVPPSLTVVAAGHYATENVVVPALAERLHDALPSLQVLPFMGTAPYVTVK